MAHTQVKFRNFSVDEYILPLMEVFYEIPGMETYSSCQGDDSRYKSNQLTGGHPERGHIYFNMPKEYFSKMLNSLRHIKDNSAKNQWILSEEFDISTIGYRLTFWPHVIPHIVRQLKSDLIPSLKN